MLGKLAEIRGVYEGGMGFLRKGHGVFEKGALRIYCHNLYALGHLSISLNLPYENEICHSLTGVFSK